MDMPDAPTCPACGFRVFNRRYPKCESCGKALPDTIVYTAAERAAIYESERLEHEALERERRDKESNSVTGLPDEFTATEALVKGF